MKIQKMQTLDFQGLAGCREWTFNHINVLCGPNRTGKSSLLNALKYGLSGEEPEGEIVRDGAPKTAVGMTFEDGTAIIRQKTAGGSNSFFLEKTRTTKTLVNHAVENSSGVPMTALRVASSEDVLRSLKPQEFRKLILSYTDDLLNTETVAAMVPDLTDEMYAELKKRLPEDEFGTNTLEAFYKQINEDRLLQRRAIIAKEETIKVLRESEKPFLTREELLLKEKEYLAKNAEVAAYKEKLAAYEKAKKLYEAQKKAIDEYHRQIDEIKAEKKSDADRQAIEEKIRKTTELMNSARASLDACIRSARDTEKVISNLSTTICPLSEKLVCTTDKTKVKDELNAALTSMRSGIENGEKTVAALAAELESLSANLKSFDKEQEEYRRKEFLMKELAKAESTKIEIPPEPKKPEVENDERWLVEIRKQLSAWDNLEKAKHLEAVVENGKRILSVFEALSKAFEPKGQVMNRITERYMTAFEDKCNEKADKLRKGMRVRFTSSDGVYVALDTDGTGTFLDYASLSGAEKALYIFLMLDLLNALSGLRIMVIDELSVLDKNTFRALVSLVMENKDDYDHIFMSAVNHDDTLQVLSEFGLAPNLLVG